MAKYKWDSAREWLDQKVEEIAARNDSRSMAELVSIYNTIVAHLDNDTIQDDFQSEMDADGFFRDLEIVTKLSREQCVKLLEGISIECRDDKTVGELRDAVESNVEDGTLDYRDVEEEYINPE